MLRPIDNRDGGREREKDIQRILCYQYDLMMMMWSPLCRRIYSGTIVHPYIICTEGLEMFAKKKEIENFNICPRGRMPLKVNF